MTLHPFAGHRAKRRLATRARAPGVACALAALGLFGSAAGYRAFAANEETADGFPLAVHCEVGGVRHFFYLSRIGTDGVAIYLTPDRMAGTITIDGTAQHAVTGIAGSCFGKSLDDLRDARQTFEMKQ